MELGGICPLITGQKHEDSDTPPLLLYSDSYLNTSDQEVHSRNIDMLGNKALPMGKSAPIL